MATKQCRPFRLRSRLEILHKDEHFMLTDVQWDPSSRCVKNPFNPPGFALENDNIIYHRIKMIYDDDPSSRFLSALLSLLSAECRKKPLRCTIDKFVNRWLQVCHYCGNSADAK